MQHSKIKQKFIHGNTANTVPTACNPPSGESESLKFFIEILTTLKRCVNLILFKDYILNLIYMNNYYILRLIAKYNS